MYYKDGKLLWHRNSDEIKNTLICSYSRFEAFNYHMTEMVPWSSADLVPSAYCSHSEAYWFDDLGNYHRVLLMDDDNE